MKERKGWEWKNGYWSRIEGPAHKHKLDFFCAHCDRITGTIDDEFIETLGICSACYVSYVETRKLPVIDLSKYSKVDLEGLDLSNRDFLTKLEKK